MTPLHDQNDQNPQYPVSNSGDTQFVTGADSNRSSEATIGSYHLIQRIGEGGMGEVWLAEQKQPVRRRVAIKLIKTGMDSREVMARFESERQALALMNHPAIAKVFDAGATPQGRPYFVMEYVSGLPITEYCDKHKLTVRERLELFTRVCEGVQHAHQKAIIHRDLKPSNILITEVDGKAAPRIIDFGVAKATSQRLTAETMVTRLGSVIGTPGYISPEQADSGGEDIDTRTDVYSLGVILYELLAGVQPLDLAKSTFAEMLRKLREEDPAAPSTKLRTRGEQSATAAQNRSAEPAALARLVRGDLDAITLKALEKDRSLRYGSPQDLAADIERYLRDEPVLARPAGVAYRARKYVRRHRLAVAAVAALVFVAVSFAVAQTIQLRRTVRERDRANRITEFMTRMFKVSDPSQARGNQVTAREILDKASNEIESGLAHDPELQVRLMYVMGTVYENLGLYGRAQALLERSLDIQRHIAREEDIKTLTLRMELANVLMFEGHFLEAEKLDRETLEIQRRFLGPEHRDTLGSMSNLGGVLWQEGKYAEGEKILRASIEIQRRAGTLDGALTNMNHLALILQAQGHYAEAEALQRELLERAARVLGAEHPNTLKMRLGLGMNLRAQKRYPEAEKQDGETLEIARRVFGPEHPDTLTAMDTLAVVLMDEGRFSEAEKLYREALQGKIKTLGPDHPDTASLKYNIACLAARQGHTKDALAELSEAIDHGLSSKVDMQIGSDTDLVSLHGDPRFEALLMHAKELAAQKARP